MLAGAVVVTLFPGAVVVTTLVTVLADAVLV